MDERLYLEDSFQKEVISPVIEKIRENGCFLVRFRETVFYPGGGGQPPDQGKVDEQEVLGLIEKNGFIYHLLAADPGKGPCRLTIDFERRFSFMQQHTAQHLLSQVLLEKHRSATLSFSLTEEHASVETDSRFFSDSEIIALENECGRIVFSNLKVRIHRISDPGRLPLRKPPKVSGPIRVIEIDSFDYSACGGTHLRSTGQIGLIKIRGCDRVRGHSRLYFLAGERALRDYQRQSMLAKELQHVLTVPPEDFGPAARKLKEERDKLQRENRELKSTALNQEVTAARLAGSCFFSRELPGLEAAEIKQLAVKALPLGIGLCLFTLAPKPFLVVADGCGGHDLKAIAKDLFSLLGGRGGGQSQLIEGSISQPQRLPKALDLLQDIFRNK